MTASRPTGRPERPVPPDSGSLGELALELRRLREDAGLTYRELGERLHYNSSALSRAASGVVKPSWAIVESLVIELGGDLDKTKELWEQAVPVSHHVPQPRCGDDTETQGPVGGRGPRHARDGGDGSSEDLDPGPSDAAITPTPRVFNGRRRWLPPSTLILIVILLGVFAAGVTVNRASEGGGGISPGPSATIVSPQFDSVSQTIQLYGTYENVPPGELIWAVTEDFSSTKRFYPQDRACFTDLEKGSFDCGTYYVGKQDVPDNGSYRILIVRANATAVNAFVDYQIKKGGPQGPNPGLAIIPEGAEVLSAKTVRRV